MSLSCNATNWTSLSYTLHCGVFEVRSSFSPAPSINVRQLQHASVSRFCACRLVIALVHMARWHALLGICGIPLSGQAKLSRMVGILAACVTALHRLFFLSLRLSVSPTICSLINTQNSIVIFQSVLPWLLNIRQLVGPPFT